MEILFVLAIAWLIVYRTGVGTWCAITGKTPPWELARESRRARAGQRAQDPNRTARGFFGRLYGDMWEDLNAWLDESRARKINDERRRTLGEWLGFVGRLAKGLWPGEKNQDADEIEGDDQDAPEYVGQTVRPPEEAPTLNTVSLPDPATSDGSEWVPYNYDTGMYPPPLEAAVIAATPSQTLPGTADTELAAAPEIADVTPPPDPGPRPGSFAGHSTPELAEKLHEEPDPRARKELFERLIDNEKAADAEAAAQRESGSKGHLSLVPAPAPANPEPALVGSAHQNSTTNGGTSMSESPNTVEVATVTTLADFGRDVGASMTDEWGPKIEQAKNAASTAKFTNDADITEAISRMDQHRQGFAEAAVALEEAMVKHKAAEEAMSGLGDAAAESTESYKRH